MNKEQGKTLYVFVFENINVSDSYKKKGFKTQIVEKPVFLVSVNDALETLFSGIHNFARPPTSQLIFVTNPKNHLVY